MNTYKCVLVGDGGVGKTSYIKKLVTNQFERKYVATLGVEVLPVTLTGKSRFNMWDTAGQEKFGGLREGYYVMANCGMICFDLTSRLTWRNVRSWYNALSPTTKNLVLIGFKADLEAKITPQEILDLTMSLGLPYFEISTKTDQAVNGPLAYLHGTLSK